MHPYNFGASGSIPTKHFPYNVPPGRGHNVGITFERPANHRSLFGCRPTAIAARVISAIQIDFALEIAAPGGLTSGFALHF